MLNLEFNWNKYLAQMGAGTQARAYHSKNSESLTNEINNTVKAKMFPKQKMT